MKILILLLGILALSACGQTPEDKTKQHNRYKELCKGELHSRYYGITNEKNEYYCLIDNIKIYY